MKTQGEENGGIAMASSHAMKGALRTKHWAFALIVGAIVVIAPGVLFAADPGVNQPGAVGNARPDPGYNQPGAVGNVGGAGADLGKNQPGAAGNVKGAKPHRKGSANQGGTKRKRRGRR